MSDYGRLLEEAGFERIGLEVTRRYSVAELREEGAAILAGLPAEAVQTLDGKVTSCAISAWKPA